MSTRRGGNPVKGLLSRTGEIHPVLSAVLFAHHATTPTDDGTLGSTMNVRTGEVARPHSPGYIVGGELDRHGQRVPTEQEPVSSNASLDRILHHRSRIAAGSDAPHAGLGYWAGPGMKSYDVDSSAIFRDRRTSMKVGRKRNETAVWDNEKMENLYPQRGGDPDRRPKR